RLWRVGKSLIARDLLGDEAVVGLVLVERAHDPIAVLPRERPIRVGAESVGLGVADDVEPEAPLPFAERGRCEQAVDETLPAVRARVALERLDVLGRWRKTESIDPCPAKELSGGSGRGRLEPFALDAREKEGVDRVFDPALALGYR